MGDLPIITVIRVLRGATFQVATPAFERCVFSSRSISDESFSGFRSSIFIDCRLPGRKSPNSKGSQGNIMPTFSVLHKLPVLPVKNTVLFPYIHMPFSVGRPASLAALETAVATEEKEILIVCQRNSAVETPGQDDLYAVGTTAVIKKTAHGDDGRVQLIVLGTER